MRRGRGNERGAVRPMLVTSASAGLVLTAFVAGYVLGKSHGWDASERAQQLAKFGSVAPVGPNRGDSRGEIDFYDTLPRTTVPTATTPAPQVEAEPQRTVVVPPPASDDDAIAGLIEQKSSYTVQVGSFHERAEADALKEKLNPLGEPVTIQLREQSDGSIWYRVQVGNYPNRGQAQKMADHIELLYQSRPLVVLR